MNKGTKKSNAVYLAKPFFTRQTCETVILYSSIKASIWLSMICTKP